MESLPPSEIHRMGERSFTCSRRKESIFPRCSRKWSCGQPGTKIPATKRLSGSYKRTKRNFWLQCSNAGRKKQSVQRLTRSEQSVSGFDLFGKRQWNSSRAALRGGLSRRAAIGEPPPQEIPPRLWGFPAG